MSCRNWKKYWLILCRMLLIGIFSIGLCQILFNIYDNNQIEINSIKIRERRESHRHDLSIKIPASLNQLVQEAAADFRTTTKISSTQISKRHEFKPNKKDRTPSFLINLLKNDSSGKEPNIVSKSHQQQRLQTNDLMSGPLRKNVSHKKQIWNYNNNKQHRQQHVLNSKQNLRNTPSNIKPKNNNNLVVVKSNLSTKTIGFNDSVSTIQYRNGSIDRASAGRVGGKVFTGNEYDEDHRLKTEISGNYKIQHKNEQLIIREEDGVVIVRKYKCIMCQVIPGQPTRQLQNSVLPQQRTRWRNRGMFVLFTKKKNGFS